MCNTHRLPDFHLSWKVPVQLHSVRNMSGMQRDTETDSSDKLLTVFRVIIQVTHNILKY